MSTNPTTGAREYQPEMQNYLQPHYPSVATESRSPNNSTVSKYVPERYTSRPGAQIDSMEHLALPSQRPPSAQSEGPFMPSDPEQYRPPPAAFSGAVPPAQLPYGYQDSRRTATGGYDDPSTRRRASAASHHSEHSRGSSRPRDHQEDRHRHHGHDHLDHGHHHNDNHHSNQKKKRHFSDQAENENHLKRKDTPRRSYGGSLFALYDNIKEAVRGG